MAGEEGRALRRKAERRGRISEWLAAAWLLIHGYRILALRYRTPLGEIDIVARKRDLIIFVEVKARSSHQSAVDAVSAPSRRRIRAASDIWISRQVNAAAFSMRYDILAITPGKFPRHFKDAF